MKKKNFLWSMFAIMMVTMLSVSLSACSSDDDDNSVVGSWSCVEESRDETPNGYVGSVSRHTYTATFKSNNTGTFTELHEHQGEESYTESFQFTYTKKSDTEGSIVLEYKSSYSGDELEYYRYVIKEKQMYIYDEDDDLEWVLTKN